MITNRCGAMQYGLTPQRAGVLSQDPFLLSGTCESIWEGVLQNICRLWIYVNRIPTCPGPWWQQYWKAKISLENTWHPPGPWWQQRWNGTRTGMAWSRTVANLTRLLTHGWGEKEQKLVAKNVQKIVASFGVVWWSGGFLNKIVASVLIHGSWFGNCDPVQNRENI